MRKSSSMAVRKGKRQRTQTASRGDRPHGSPLADRLRPWLLGGMCALFVARPLFPSEGAARQGDGLPVVMLWLVLAALWGFGAIARPRFRVRFGWTDAAVLLLIAWHTIAALWAAKHLSPRPAVNMLWEWIALGLAFFLARQLIAGRREARAIVAVMIALAVALSAYGLYQYAHELPNQRAEYAGDLDRAMRDAGVWFPPGAPERQAFKDRLESKEPYATFALANSLAGYLAPWLVVLAGVGISAGPGRRRLWIWVGVVCAGLPIAACLLLTKSRSGWLAFLFGMFLLLVWLGWSLLHRMRGAGRGWRLPAAVVAFGVIILAVGVCVAVSLGMATGALDREVLSEASKSLGYRVQYWRSSLRMIGDHPLVGCGPGNFQNAYTAYKLPEASEEVADPHNFLLEVWATAGTPAMLALLAV
ncbi:MAG: O-antigen ligase family protein, partial [Planctomycetota bacterium]